MNNIQQQSLSDPSKTKSPFEERTDEVQTIIDRMPTIGATYVAWITTALVVVTLIFSFFIQYPDTVDGEISITAFYAPVKIVSASSGRLHLLKSNNEMVKQGEIISWIDNAASYQEINQLSLLLKQYTTEINVGIDWPEKMELGEISSIYSNFLLAHKQYCRFIADNSYRTQRKNLLSQIAADSTILKNVEQEILLRNQTLQLASEKHRRDSLMWVSKAFTDAEMTQSKMDFLAKQENYQSLLTNRSTLISRINSNRIAVSQTEIEECEKRESYLSALLANLNELSNGIEVWEQRYAVYAPIDGKLEYLSFWRENIFVKQNDPLYSIIPAKNKMMGEVIVPSYGIGKVKIGQEVNVKIDNFPYDEYGSINGKVNSISHMSNTMETSNGAIKTYLVTVEFPEGSRTNYGKELDLNFETHGMAEIITKRKRLIERLFDNLKYKFVE